MAETEVENILREIRERVLLEQRSLPPSLAAVVKTGNGDGEADSKPTHQRSEPETEGKLQLLDSYLTTTARTWDRLPPLVSNRSGAIAGLELWLKRQLKRATRWFTWEQVNFNASVHYSLRDLLSIISAHEQELARLQVELQAQLQARQNLQAQNQTEVLGLSAELAALRRTTDEQTRMLDELRDRVSHLTEEQRVSFKQTALEFTEAAQLEDRARRRTETLVEELQRRIEQLEPRK